VAKKRRRPGEALAHRLLTAPADSEPKRHHLLPQFHLRRFATDAEQLQVISMKDPAQRFCTSVEKAASQHDFYMVQATDGKPSRVVERLLHVIEDDAAPVIRRILEGGEFPPGPHDREVLASFLAFQAGRGRDRREAWNVMTDYTAKVMTRRVPPERFREIFRSREGRDPSTDELDRFMALVGERDSWSLVPHQNEAITAMLKTTPPLVPYILQRDWVLLRFPEPGLLTADTPVAVWQEHPAPGMGIGVGNADDIRVTLDRRHVLVLARPGRYPGSGVWDHEQRYAAIYNQSTVDAAYEWLYHHPDDDALGGVEIPPARPALELVEHPRVPTPEGGSRQLIQFRANVPR